MDNLINNIMLAKKYLLILFFSIQLLLVPAVNSEIYKSIDENGRITYSNKPLTDNANKINIKNSPKQDIETRQQLQKQQKLLNVIQEERDEEIALKQKQKKEKEEQEKKCSEMKEHLNKMKQAGLLYKKTDDPDNPSIYTDEEREVAEARLETLIKEKC